MSSEQVCELVRLLLTPIDLTNHRVHRTAILDGLINEYQIAS